jgi:hypothetical protein
MRIYALLSFTALALLGAAHAQENKEARRSAYTYDPDGRRQLAYDSENASGPRGSTQTQMVVDANGREVPLETTEETVISDGPDGRVIERIVKRFDSQGRPASQEKVRIEETRTATGSTVRATVFDRDLNGQFALRERSTTATSKDGLVTRAETMVERPSVNGSLDLQERQVAVTTGDDKKSLRDVTVFRKDQQGSLAPAVREMTEITREGATEVANTSEYNTASTGKMELAGQKLSRTVKNADGSESQVIDVFGANNPGQARSGFSGQPRLRERQLIDRTPGPNKSVVETLSIQRPDLDSDKLSAPRKVSETVCQGSCQ